MLGDSCQEKVAKFTSEMFGTFSLVFAGTGAIVINDISQGVVTHAGIAMTFGLVVAAMVYALGGTSGAHLNPVVSLMFWMMRRLTLKDLSRYVSGQLTGALLASATLRVLFQEHASLGATNPSGSAVQSFVLEIILTMILLFVILQVSTGDREKGVIAGVAVGGVVGFEAMFAGPVSGASMNPFRSLAPALITGSMQHVWIYITAPVIGGFLALIFHRLCRP